MSQRTHHSTMEEPPEGVMRGETVPPGSEPSEYERLKHERLDTLEKIDRMEKRSREAER